MIKIELDQGTLEWLLWRKGKITASSVGAIMGLNPYEDVKEFWEIFTERKVKKVTAAMSHGSRNEDKARRAFILRTGIIVAPACIVHDDYPFLAASLDGLSEDEKYVAEIKCPYKDYSFYSHKKKVPPYYYSQVQHQLYVSGAEKGFFYSWYSGRDVIHEVYPNEDFISEMLTREFHLIDCYENGKEPDWELFYPYAGVLK